MDIIQSALSLRVRSGFLGLLDTASLNTTKKAWGGLIKTDHNVFAQGGIRAPLVAEDTIQRTQSPADDRIKSRAVVTSFLLLEDIASNSLTGVRQLSNFSVLSRFS